MSDQPNYTYPNQPQPPQYTGQYQQAPHTGQYQQGSAPGYAQAYGQQLPEHMEKPLVPKVLKTAALLVYCMVGLSIISELLGVFFYQEIQAQAADRFASLLGVTDFQNGVASQEAFETQVQTVGTVIGLSFSLLINGAVAFMAYLMVKGHNWARIVLTIHAALTATGVFGVILWFVFFHWSMLVSFLAAVLAIAALCFFWQRPANEYMQRSRIYKQWVQQQSYLASRP